MEKDLSQLVERLKAVAGSNLKCLALYGSATSGGYQPRHSDLNLIAVLGRLEPADLEKLHPAVAWWEGKGQGSLLVFSLEELRRSADIFAIELLDIQASRRILFGEDIFAALEVPIGLHQQQVERELRSGLVRLRQRYLAGTHTTRSLLELMTASVSTFLTLFRHVLIALGQPAPSGKREAVDSLAAMMGFDASAFHALLEVREGKRRENEVDVPATFRSYVQAIERVADEVDRRFAAGS